MATFFVCSLIEFAKFGCGRVKPITPKKIHAIAQHQPPPAQHLPATYHSRIISNTLIHHPTRNTPGICDQAPPATPWTTSYATPFQSHPQSTSTNKHSPDTITYHRQHAFRPPPTTPQHPLRHLPPHSAIKHHHQQSNNSPSKFCDPDTNTLHNTSLLHDQAPPMTHPRWHSPPATNPENPRSPIPRLEVRTL